MTKVFCIMGPTACGKTDLAVQLVQQAPFEIISVDSAMVYRNMNIGTAKPTADILKIAPHRLIDIRDPAENYSVGDFYREVQVEIANIAQNQKIPLLVGGTLLYFYLLQQGLSQLPETDEAIRLEIAEEARQVGWEKMHAKLAKLDPVSAARIKSTDPQRIGRALELYAMTGKTMTEWHQLQVREPARYEFINMVLAENDRPLLHQRIADRFQQMLQQGFIEEVKKLYERGDLTPELSSIRTVGYRQIWQYLAGEYNYETMCERAIFATRQFAKRQFTWLRRWQDALWLQSGALKNISLITRYIAE